MSKPDRRVTRTREALQRAMVELIREKGFEATSISEIAERANVGRSTFYAHFADKEDLLQGSGEMLRAHLQAQVDRLQADPQAASHPVLAFSRPMLEHAAEARELFLAMVGRRSGYLFQELAFEMWASFVRQAWPDADEVAVQIIAGGFGATLAWWLSSRPELSPAEVDRRFQAFVGPALPPRPTGAPRPAK